MQVVDIDPLDCPGVRRTYQQLLRSEGKEAAQTYLKVVTTGLKEMPAPLDPGTSASAKSPSKLGSQHHPGQYSAM